MRNIFENKIKYKITVTRCYQANNSSLPFLIVGGSRIVRGGGGFKFIVSWGCNSWKGWINLGYSIDWGGCVNKKGGGMGGVDIYLPPLLTLVFTFLIKLKSWPLSSLWWGGIPLLLSGSLPGILWIFKEQLLQRTPLLEFFWLIRSNCSWKIFIEFLYWHSSISFHCLSIGFIASAMDCPSGHRLGG